MDLKERVEEALGDVRDFLKADGGDCEIVAVEGGRVDVRLKGACKGCPFSQLTLKTRIEAIIKERVPEVEEVRAVD